MAVEVVRGLFLFAEMLPVNSEPLPLLALRSFEYSVLRFALPSAMTNALTSSFSVHSEWRALRLPGTVDRARDVGSCGWAAVALAVT